MTVPGFSTAGDGLIRPVNAPAGQQVLPGVQPGTSSGTTLAQYVIIFGNSSGGAEPGLFIYAAGTSPGPGNPPIYSDSNATQDPYGNAIAPGIWAGQYGGTQAGLQASGGIGQLAFPVAGTHPLEVGGIAGIAAGTGGAEVQIFSPLDDAPQNDRALFILADDISTGGASAAYFLVYQDAGNVNHVQAQGDFQGLTLTAVAGLTAVLPGTGTSNTNAAEPETWHSLTLDAGWTVVNQPQYRLLPGIGVQVAGLATHAATAAQTNINGSNPVPSAYWPAVTRYYRPPQAADTAGAVDIQSNGIFVMRASGFNATQAIMDGIYAQ